MDDQGLERRPWPQYRPDDCPDAPHRGPQGPNEDLSQCGLCLALSHRRRPAGETFGQHLVDCSLPVDHLGFCVPGGSGHPPSEVISW